MVRMHARHGPRVVEVLEVGLEWVDARGRGDADHVTRARARRPVGARALAERDGCKQRDRDGRDGALRATHEADVPRSRGRGKPPSPIEATAPLLAQTIEDGRRAAAYRHAEKRRSVQTIELTARGGAIALARSGLVVETRTGVARSASPPRDRTPAPDGRWAEGCAGRQLIEGGLVLLGPDVGQRSLDPRGAISCSPIC